MSPFVREALTYLALAVAACVLAFLFAYTAKAAEECASGEKVAEYLPAEGDEIEYTGCLDADEQREWQGWLDAAKKRPIPVCSDLVERDCWRWSMQPPAPSIVVHVTIPPTVAQTGGVKCDISNVTGPPCVTRRVERTVTITVEPSECASCGTEGDTGRVGPPPGWTPPDEEEATRQASVGDGGGESTPPADSAPTPTQTPASEPEPTPEEQWAAEQGECVSREAVTAAIVEDANTWRYSSNALIAAWRSNPC